MEKRYFYAEWLHTFGWTGTFHPDVHGFATYRSALKEVNKYLPRFSWQDWRIRHGDEVVSLWVKGKRIKRSRIPNAS